MLTKGSRGEFEKCRCVLEPDKVYPWWRLAIQVWVVMYMYMLSRRAVGFRGSEATATVSLLRLLASPESRAELALYSKV